MLSSDTLQKREVDYHFDLAQTFAQRHSQDPRTALGCLITDPLGNIVSSGSNSLPYGVREDRTSCNQPRKYFTLIHAEIKAILVAARNGVSMRGTTMWLPWYPCHVCAQSIIEMRIQRLVCTEPTSGVGTGRRHGHDFGRSWVESKWLLSRSEVREVRVEWRP